MDEEYLQPDFDYNTLKVGALRRILTENHIEFPPHAKKAALKRLYEERIIPLLPRLRKKYLHAKPSSEGIVSIEEEKRKESERKGSSSNSSSRRGRRKSSSGTSTSGRKRNRDTLDKEDQEDSLQQNKRDVAEIDLTSTPTSTDLEGGVQSAQKTRRKLANSGTSSASTSSAPLNADLSAASSSSEALRSPKTQPVDPVTPPSLKKRKRTSNRSIGKERTPIIDKVQRKTKAYNTSESHNVQEFTISSTSSASSSSSLLSENENENENGTANGVKDNDIDIDMDSNSDSDSDNQVSSSPERHTSLTSAPVSAPNGSSRYEQFSTSFETYSFKPSGHLSKKVDFTYKRRPLIPELDRLSVSPEFAEHLRQTLQENDDRKRSTTGTQIDKKPPVPVPTTKTTIGQSQSSSATSVLPFGNSAATSEQAYRGMESGSNFHSTSEQGLVEIVDIDVDNDNEEDSTNFNSKHAKTFEVVESDSQESGKVCYREQDQEESTDDVISSSDESFLLDEVVTTDDSEIEDTEPLTDGTREEESATIAKPTHTIRSALCKSIKFLFKSFFFLFVFGTLTITVLFALWYRQQRILVGYCGHEVNSSIFSQTYPDNEVIRNLDSFLEDYKPSCIPCPDHAICYPYMKIKCKPEYTLRRSKWSLLGILPVGDSCAKDDRREQLVKEVVDRSLDFLRAKNAQVSCGNGHDDISSGMSEELLYDIFQEAKATWIGNDEFDEIWEQVVEDLKNESEIVYRQLPSSESYIPLPTDQHISRNDILPEKENIQPGRRRKELQYFRSVSKDYINLKCRFEVQVLQVYENHKVVIWLLVLVALVGKYVSYSIRKRIREKARIKELTNLTIDKLKIQRLRQKSAPYLSSVHLRDLLLSDVSNIKYRNYLWNQVSRKVENNNTTVKSSLMEIHGEVMKCWEWVGPIDPGYDDNTIGNEKVKVDPVPNNCA